MSNKAEQAIKGAQSSHFAAKGCRPRWVIGITITLLCLATLARHSGTPAPPTHCSADFGRLSRWSGAEEEVIRLKNRVRKDYESLRLLYQIASRINNLQAQQEAFGRPAASGNNRYGVTGPGKGSNCNRSYLTAQAVSKKQPPSSI